MRRRMASAGQYREGIRTVKPLRARIREAASSTGIGEQVIEKDYALSYILAGIAAQPEMSGSMIFKGGTALKKLFFGDYRFSEDLDFSTLDSPKGDDLDRAVRQAVAHSGSLLSEHGAFALWTLDICCRVIEKK